MVLPKNTNFFPLPSFSMSVFSPCAILHTATGKLVGGLGLPPWPCSPRREKREWYSRIFRSICTGFPVYTFHRFFSFPRRISLPINIIYLLGNSYLSNYKLCPGPDIWFCQKIQTFFRYPLFPCQFFPHVPKLTRVQVHIFISIFSIVSFCLLFLEAKLT